MDTEQKKDSQSPSACPVDSLPLDKLSLKEDKVDRLSQLPPELIRAIFRLAYAEGRGPSRPLSRFLSVFHNEIVYANVLVDCNNCLKGFMHKVSNRPELGQLVKRMSISTQDKADKGEQQPSAPPTTKALTAFLSKLINLQALTVDVAPRIVNLLLQVKFAEKNLQKMQSLSLRTRLDGRLFPFHPKHYVAIAGYSSPVEFCLNIPPSLDALVPSLFLVDLSAGGHFGRLTSLTLHGARLDSINAYAILRGCDKLRELTLVDESGMVELVPILEALPRTSSLRELQLQSPLQPETLFLEDLEPFLHRVDHLCSLTVAGAFAITSSFFDAVRSLKVHLVALGPDTPLSPTLLLEQLHSSALPSTLGHLRLDHVVAIRGAATDPDDPEDVYVDEDTGEPFLPPGWVPPVWEDEGDWTAEIVQEVREAAERVGVEVSGMVFQAKEIEEEFMREVEKLDAFHEALAESAAKDLEALATKEEDNENDWTDEDEDEEGDEEEDEQD